MEDHGSIEALSGNYKYTVMKIMFLKKINYWIKKYPIAFLLSFILIYLFAILLECILGKYNLIRGVYLYFIFYPLNILYFTLSIFFLTKKEKLNLRITSICIIIIISIIFIKLMISILNSLTNV